MEKIKVGLLVGSLRKESFNRKTAKYLMEIAPEGYSLELVEIGQLPFYNEDSEGDALPASYADFRKQIEGFDAFIFVTPEYNRSLPAVLKNAIDVASRPYGKSKWGGKPGAVISVSIGAIGGFGANHHLRQSLVFVDVPTMAQPEAYIGNAAKLFDEQGKLINEDTQKFLKGFMGAFEKWVARFVKK
ncbi:NADPH-dependent FMN reductase [Sphingobacterium humi]|uniref:ACP phosphodiesterase n=1 Tax=Sphingobacterium humi TaxID=1796905 RepID=A0A6N8L4T7_9SPHI|nr:NADPH-dependent FMN reductase [Sphingobacterium humi]MVZ62772.1 ACP phosphodiesterase [Sphingobacterium humi]